MVECRYLGGWGDAEWTENDEPMRFKTKKEAERAINEFINDTKIAAKRGDMLAHDRNECRAIKEKPHA
jgi:hypothetical protein